jgi:hypothetical protein
MADYEQGDPNAADGILGADWHPPTRDLQAKAWADHPERERLEKLWHERDENGERTWKQWLQADLDDPDWTELWLGPVDEYDISMPPERIGNWHKNQDAEKVEVARKLSSASTVPTDFSR